MEPNALATTRRALHGVAELVIAGPQFAAHGDIRLQVMTGGIAGAVSQVCIEGGDLVWDGGRTRLAGTCRSLAEAAGLTAEAPGVYGAGSGVDPDEVLTFDSDALALLLAWFVRGDAALRAFEPDAERVLWPEHFDVGYALDEVNYGVSPGDVEHDAPYAYVGPWTQRQGPFWNASFGAARAARDLPGVDDILLFFSEGRTAAGSG